MKDKERLTGDEENERWGSTERETLPLNLSRSASFISSSSPLQQVCTLSKHPQLLRSSMQRGGQVPVWEAGLLMPRGRESPSPALLADKGPALIMCNVIVPPLPLHGGPYTHCDRGAPLCYSSAHLYYRALSEMQVLTGTIKGSSACPLLAPDITFYKGSTFKRAIPRTQHEGLYLNHL